MSTLLSVDLGTTVCKAALYSLDGQLISSSAIEYPLISPSPERAEQDAELWWTLAVRAIQETTAKDTDAAKQVKALSISSQGISFVPIAQSGKVLGNALCWLDTRAVEEAAAIQAQIGDDRLFAITGKRPSPAYMLPKLLWLRDHEPALFAETDRFLMAHDYLVYRLCEAMVTDYSLAGGTMLLDIRNLTWCEDLLAAYAIPQGKLPGLAWSGSVAGELSSKLAQILGLPVNIPVVIGGQDQKCAALGASIRPGVATISLGTASAISCLTTTPTLDSERRIPAFPFVVPGYWVLEGVVGTAGAAIRWARDTFFPNEAFATLDEWASRAKPGANGVRFYPHLAGATSPFWDSHARGSFTGLSLASERGDILRAILEGIAFQIKTNLDVIETMAPVEELVLFGGGARSELWRKIISQVCGKPLRVASAIDVANWGACLLAGVGAGLFENPLVPISSGSSTTQYIPEGSSFQHYQNLYEEYLKSCDVKH